MQAIKTTLGATAIATSALLAAAVLKTPKVPENELSAKERTELVAQRNADKEARTYNWNDNQSFVQNVADGAVTTGENIKQGAIYAYDKATDNPIPLTGAFALSTLGLGAAAIVDKKKKAQAQSNAEKKEEKLTYMQAKEQYEEYLNALNRGLWGLDRIKYTKADYIKLRDDLKFQKCMGRDKGSYGYSPDGDHVYGESSAESQEHYEWRIKKLEQETENARRIYHSAVDSYNERKERMFHHYMREFEENGEVTFFPELEYISKID